LESKLILGYPEFSLRLGGLRFWTRFATDDEMVDFIGLECL